MYKDKNRVCQVTMANNKVNHMDRKKVHCTGTKIKTTMHLKEIWKYKENKVYKLINRTEKLENNKATHSLNSNSFSYLTCSETDIIMVLLCLSVSYTFCVNVRKACGQLELCMGYSDETCQMVAGKCAIKTMFVWSIPPFSLEWWELTV